MSAWISVSKMYEIKGRPSTETKGLRKALLAPRRREPSPAIKITASVGGVIRSNRSVGYEHQHEQEKKSQAVISFQTPQPDALWKKSENERSDFRLKHIPDCYPRRWTICID